MTRDFIHTLFMTKNHFPSAAYKIKRSMSYKECFMDDFDSGRGFCAFKVVWKYILLVAIVTLLLRWQIEGFKYAI